jgi:hypothetical protein
MLIAVCKNSVVKQCPLFAYSGHCSYDRMAISETGRLIFYDKVMNAYYLYKKQPEVVV